LNNLNNSKNNHINSNILDINNFKNQTQINLYNNDMPNIKNINNINNYISNNSQIQNYLNQLQNNTNGINGINGENKINGVNGINDNHIPNKNGIFNGKKKLNGTNSTSGISDTKIDLFFKQLTSQNKKPNFIFIIDQLGKNFIEIIKTYKGSRYLQELLPKEKISKKESNYITKVIGKDFNEIICDYYGNYFLQKLFPLLIREDRVKVYNYIQNNFIKISCDISGNYSLQCLIMLSNSNEEKVIIKKLTINNLDILCFDQNGSHIIEKIIIVFKEIEREYLNKYILENLIKLSTDINGSLVVKAFLINLKNEFIIKEVIIIFCDEANNLCFNQFGSDIIITFLDIFGYQSIKIINILISNIVNLSISKYSSKVILFLLDYLEKKIFFKFLDCLKLIFIDENNFKEMIKNKFSSYVIQKSFQIIISIDADYFNCRILSKDGINNFNSSESDSSNDKEDEKQSYDGNDNNSGENEFSEKKKENIKKNSSVNNSIISYEKFVELKKKIFYIFENNSSNKEKEKILNLLKQNYNYYNFVNNKNLDGIYKNQKSH
jgi:hypothetical protein